MITAVSSRRLVMLPTAIGTIGFRERISATELLGIALGATKHRPQSQVAGAGAFVALYCVPGLKLTVPPNSPQ